MDSTLLIKNCRLLDPPHKEKSVDILIKDKIIERTGEIDLPEIETDSVINADGRIASPGFIDVHIQGAGGADILDGTKGALQTISKTLSRFGVTGFLATTVVKPDQNNKHLINIVNNIETDLGGAKILGIHLEGPFVSLKKRGGISPDSIYPPSEQSLNEILDVTGSHLKMMTIAPEIKDNLEIIKNLRARNVIASFGHSDATYEQTKEGIRAGINHVTHIFNAMRTLHHRDPGPLPAIFETGSISAQIISDGVHIHKGVVKLLYKILGQDRCICITDGIQAMGLPEGRYFYNGREYESKNGAARYLDDTLIGTSLSVGEIAQRFRKFTDCSLGISLDTITKNPAKLLGIYNKGSIDVGKDADIAILDYDSSIWLTLVNGKVVYRK